jgi:hypothetical protein
MVPSATLSQYRRIAQSASPETLRTHKLTRRYSRDFFRLARDMGTQQARAWVLGRLILDLHPITHADTTQHKHDPEVGQPSHCDAISA